MESILSFLGYQQRLQVWRSERSQKCSWGARGAAGGLCRRLQCKGHIQLAEGTALGLVTEDARVACPTETLRGLWGHVTSGEGGQSQGEEL